MAFRAVGHDAKEVPMNGPGDSQGTNDARSASEDAVALTEDELRAYDAEPLPNREAMSTLIWAPAPGVIASPVDGIVGDERV
jgi:hypothetical protein